MDRSSSVIWSQPAQAIAANGNSAVIDVSAFRVGILAVYATAVSGTTPTLDVALDQQDAFGNWLLANYQLTQLTSAPNYAFAAIGLTYPLLNAARVRWTVGGTTPSWTAAFSFIGH